MEYNTSHPEQYNHEIPADAIETLQSEHSQTGQTDQMGQIIGQTICQGRDQPAQAPIEQALHLTAQSEVYFVAAAADTQPQEDQAHARIPFELFKSNVCHRLKALGDTGFVVDLLAQNTIRRFFEEGSYRESLYLLGMLDYISRLNTIPLCTAYDDLRQYKLPELIYPASILCLCHALQSEEPKVQTLREAIPEFLQFNIVESEVHNVV